MITTDPHWLDPAPGSTRILRGLTACYMRRAGRHTDAELRCFDVLIELVLARVVPLARAELAEQLADHTRPPPRVLRRLASDEIRIATPILVRSPALTDADLEDLARSQSQSHLAVIATRRPLAARVTDVLVARGDNLVADLVVRNLEAKLTLNSLTQLAERSAAGGALSDLLLARPDLPEEIARKLDPVIRETLNEAIETLCARVDGPTRDSLAHESQVMLAHGLRVATARPSEVLRELVARGVVGFDDAVIELADADQAFDVARLLGERLSLSGETAMMVLFASSEEAMAIVCRAAGLRVNGFSSVLRLRRRRRQGHHTAFRPPAEALTAFSRIDTDTARRAMALFRRRTPRNGHGARGGGRV